MSSRACIVSSYTTIFEVHREICEVNEVSISPLCRMAFPFKSLDFYHSRSSHNALKSAKMCNFGKSYCLPSMFFEWECAKIWHYLQIGGKTIGHFFIYQFANHQKHKKKRSNFFYFSSDFDETW